MKHTLLILICTLAFTSLQAQQKFMTRSGTVNFVAEGPVKDDVKAVNKQGVCVLDASSGEVIFQVAIKSFVFKKALMQEHFNENYMESHKYPKAVLKGKIMDWEKVDLSKNGSYEVQVQGEMDLHGVKQHITEKGKLEVKNGKILLSSDFMVKLADYNISIPKLVEDKIAKEAEVSLRMELEAR